MSLAPPVKVGKLQDALHSKAKNAPGYRFYALYDKLYREDILHYASARCKAHGGAAGVDGQTFADIESYGVRRWLDELTNQLRKETYQPQPVRRVFIPKGDGKRRPLGIPMYRSYCTSFNGVEDLRGGLALPWALSLSGRRMASPGASSGLAQSGDALRCQLDPPRAVRHRLDAVQDA
jgi:hypothetical protein